MWKQAVFAVLGVGCASSAADAPRATEPTTRPEITVPDSFEFKTKVALDGRTLKVSILSEQRCRWTEADFDDHECMMQPFSNRHVLLRSLDSDWTFEADTDERGVAAFDLTDAPESAFHPTHDDGDHGDPEFRFALKLAATSTDLAIGTKLASTLLSDLASDGGSRIAMDRAAVEAAHRERVEHAHQAMLECSSALHTGDLKTAASCWRDHLDQWSAIDVQGEGVAECIDATAARLDTLATCVAMKEKSDDEVVAKAECLDQPSSVRPSCGPFDLSRVGAERLARLDFDKVKQRVDTRAAAIVERRARAAAAEEDRRARLAAAEEQRRAAQEAAEEAKRKACLGDNVIQVVAQISIGRDADESKMRHCVYNVAPGRVATTTRDGWVIVTWGDDVAAAFRTNKAHSDGSLFRTSATAKYVGIARFDRTDGGTASLPAFKLSE